MKQRSMLFKMATLAAILLFAGCNKEENLQNDLNKIINVEVCQVSTNDGSLNMSYSGTIEESEATTLSFSGLGTVSKVLVSEGDFVHKGQVLAILNSESSKNMYDMALATQKQAEDAYKRLLPMYKNGNLPEIKLVEIETQVQQAKSMAATAKKNYDDCNLISPVDGIVGKRSIDPGMSALPGMASITIVRIEKVFAKVPVPEKEISDIKKGEKAMINIQALNSRFEGNVEEIGVMADQLSHTYKIKIGIQNKDKKIKPGMICSVNLAGGKKDSGVIIPNQAITVNENDKRYVYVVNTGNNTVSRRYIQTGNLIDGGVELISGLVPGETIVTRGQQKLVENSTVQITNR